MGARRRAPDALLCSHRRRRIGLDRAVDRAEGDINACYSATGTDIGIDQSVLVQRTSSNVQAAQCQADPQVKEGGCARSPLALEDSAYVHRAQRTIDHDSAVGWIDDEVAVYGQVRHVTTDKQLTARAEYEIAPNRQRTIHIAADGK